MKDYYCKQCGRKYDGSHHSKDYCRKHEMQLKKYGKFLDSNPRNNFDPNEFRFIANYVEFDVYDQVTSEVIDTFMVDAEDYPIVSKYKWRLVNGYAKSSTQVLLHRLLLNPKKGQQVDHVNLNTKDNRKNNLRIADNSLNSSNRRPYNKVNIKGVELHRNGKYSAYFRIEDTQYHSPCYRTVEEAAFARFILEQMFRAERLTQFSTKLIESLSLEQKKNIIDGIKRKFNKE